MIKLKTLQDFQSQDWQFDSELRQWVHKAGIVKFTLERGETNSVQTLKDKLVCFNQVNYEPTEKEMNQKV